MSLAQSYAFIMKKGSAKVLMEVGNMFQANKTIVFKKSFRSLENEPFKLFKISESTSLIFLAALIGPISWSAGMVGLLQQKLENEYIQ